MPRRLVLWGRLVLLMVRLDLSDPQQPKPVRLDRSGRWDLTGQWVLDGRLDQEWRTPRQAIPEHRLDRFDQLAQSGR